jgi:hypothetical protein
VKQNEGTVDRIVRVVFAAVLLSLLVIGPVPGWGLFGLIGLFPLTTGLLGFCPVYVPFGIDTRERGRAAHA